MLVHVPVVLRVQGGGSLMARAYAISGADLKRLVSMLQRQPLGVRFAGGRLRVTECHSGSWIVTDVDFKPLEGKEGKGAR